MDTLTIQVIETVARMLERTPGEFSSDTKFVQDLDFDSTSFLELLLLLEGDLDVEFDPDTFGPSGFETVASLVDYVRPHLDS